jgi:hypothetical protein
MIEVTGWGAWGAAVLRPYMIVVAAFVHVQAAKKWAA